LHAGFKHYQDQPVRGIFTKLLNLYLIITQIIFKLKIVRLEKLPFLVLYFLTVLISVAYAANPRFLCVFLCYNRVAIGVDALLLAGVAEIHQMKIVVFAAIFTARNVVAFFNFYLSH
jgi:hypothetical protein